MYKHREPEDERLKAEAEYINELENNVLLTIYDENIPIALSDKAILDVNIMQKFINDIESFNKEYSAKCREGWYGVMLPDKAIEHMLTEHHDSMSTKLFSYLTELEMLSCTIRGRKRYFIKGSKKYLKAVTIGMHRNDEVMLEELEYTAPPVTSLWDMTATKTPWLIPDFIPSKGMGEIFGPSTHKKTFIILDMLFCIANGLDYHGRVVEHGTVVYYAGEDMENIVPRIQALEKHYNIECDREKFLLPAKPIDLLDGTGMDEIPECKIIVFDTLSKLCGAGYDPSQTSHWTSISANLNRYVKPVADVVMWVAHTGLSNTDRSAGTKQRYNDADFVLRIMNKTKPKLTITKMKNSETTENITFAMKKVNDTLIATLPKKLNNTDQAVLKLLGNKSSVTKDEFYEAVEEVYNPEGDKSKEQIRNQRRKIKERLEGILNVGE